MNVYLVGDKRIFDGIYPCPPNPFEEGEFLTPSVEYLTVAPPTTAEHQSAVANAQNTEWVIVANFIGTKYWLADGSEHEITELNVSPPENALFEKPEPPQTKFTVLEFLELFTETEQLAVVEVTMTVTAVKLWYDKMLASTFVDLNDQRTSAGLTALVAEGLIPQSRYDEIMGVAQ